MNKALKIAAFWAVLGGVAWASLKVWSTGEIIRSTDLNANFSELNTTKVGGTVKLTNSDVSTSAAIAHSKLATPALLPKAFAAVNSTCNSSPCTLTSSSKVTTITRSGDGAYAVTLAYAPANASFGVFLYVNSAHWASYGLGCLVTNLQQSAPQFTIACNRTSDGAAEDPSGFTILVMDNDN